MLLQSSGINYIWSKNNKKNPTKTKNQKNKQKKKKKKKKQKQQSKKITQNLPVADRIDKLQEKEAYKTIKDHKDDFPNKIFSRLINRCKSSIGKISKVIVDRINTAVRNNTNINQWKDTSTVIDWFKNISDKNLVILWYST